MEDEELVRLFSHSLATLQATGDTSGDLEVALYRHISTSSPPPVPSSPSHAPLYFIAAQWLLLYSTLLLSHTPPAHRRPLLHLTRTSHMPLCWQFLSAIPHPPPSPAPATLLLQLDVAQRLGSLPLLSRTFDALHSACSHRPMDVEEAVVLFTAAPHLGRWADMTRLGAQLEELAEGWLEALAASAQARDDIPDYTVLYRMAQAEVERSSAGKGGEEKEGEGEGEPGTVGGAGRVEAAFREWELVGCESRYRSVDCSHSELQEHAERIHGGVEGGWVGGGGGEGGLVDQAGEVWTMASGLGSGWRVQGLVGLDGVMRLEGAWEREEGAAGKVKWTEVWEMRRVGGGEEEEGEGGRWEGERWVVRVRRRYAGRDEDDVEVVVRWHWDVRWQLQPVGGGTQRGEVRAEEAA